MLIHLWILLQLRVRHRPNELLTECRFDARTFASMDSQLDAEDAKLDSSSSLIASTRIIMTLVENGWRKRFAVLPVASDDWMMPPKGKLGR